jgi:hypothetical protein
MAASQITITLLSTYGGGTLTLAIPTALTTLDAESGGFNGPDIVIRNLFKAGVFQVNGVWYPTAAIESITSQ